VRSSRFLKYFILLSGILLIGPPFEDVSARDLNQPYVVQSPRFILYFGKNTRENSRSILTQEQLAKYAFEVLDGVYKEYTELFGTQPTKKITLRFLSPEEFKKYTGAPAWTSAMYFNDEITIPLNPEKGVILKDLGRAIRHEYAHAVIAELSESKCPAWLDEGLAQLLEGKINPLLGPALRKWISSNDAMPLSWLRNGFTLLDEKIVPVAYAQSLFASRKIVKEYGYEKVSYYLALLHKGTNDKEAFESAFKITQKEFLTDLTYEIKEWARYGDFNP
jgi:hypothetical protein